MGRFAVTVFFLVLFQSSYSSGTSPQFTAQPSDIIVAPSSSTTINCRASGTPQPTIEWYKDNVRVVLDGTHTVNGSGSLHISMVTGTDAGSYHCVASNAVGSVRSFSATLQIASFATFTPPSLQSSEILANDPYTLPCMLPPSSVPPATVSWKHSNQPITPPMLEGGGLGITLNGTAVLSSWSPATDTGGFMCTVTNPLDGSSQQSSSYFLSLLQGPARSFIPIEFVAFPPPYLTAIAGGKVQLECFTTGSPLANITWQKDGAELVPSQRVSLAQARRVLTLDPVVEGDGGRYTCMASQVTNSGLTTLQTSTQLSVIVPPTITQSFPETAVNASLSVSLTCRAHGSLPLTWTWRRNGEELTSGRVGYGQSGTESTLTITGVEVGDGGVYQCLVQQTAYHTADAANELLVVRTVSPFFTQGSALQDMLVFTGSTVLFPCMAIGFPPPQFTWIKTGTFQVDTGQERFHIPDFPSSNCSLTITSALTLDTAAYQCNASNSVGHRATPAVQLHVIASPPILESPMSQTPSEGDTVTLRCRISTTAQVEYSWLRDGGRVPAPTAGDFTLTNIQQSQNGVYGCTASISVSGVNAPALTMEVGRAVVTVGALPTPPSPPLNPTITGVSTNSFLAHWDIPMSNGSLDLQNYTIEIQALGSPLCPQVEPVWSPAVTGVGPSNTSVTVGGLFPYTRYQFRVVAFNFLFASSPSTVSAIVWTEETVPSAPPTDLVASPQGMGGELMVTWNPPTPCTTYGGPLTDYTVQSRVVSTGVYRDNLVGSNATRLLLSSLSALTQYEIRVAAHTMAGRGIFTSSVVATTSGALTVAPPVPTNVAGRALNSTAVQLTWQALTNCGEVRTYVVTYQLGDDVVEVFLNNQTLNFIVGNLEPAVEYTFTVSAQSEVGGCIIGNTTLTTPALTGMPFYEMVWFYAVCGVVGLLVVCVVVMVCVCLCCKICCKVGSENGKIYITTRRSGSSLSAASGSSGFSEYQQKHKVISRFVRVHGSPTPSRRSSDYADLEAVRQGNVPGMGAPSMSYSDSPAMMNGHLDPHGWRPYSAQDQYNPDIPMGCLDRYDHMPMNPNFPDTSSTPGLLYTAGMPAPPPPNFPDLQPPSQMTNFSQDSEPSWNPADNLNYRGHMTNNPVSRSSSMRSTQSTVSADSSIQVESDSGLYKHPRSHYKEPRRSAAGSGVRTQLSPVQEHQVMEGEAHSSMPVRRMRAIQQMSSHSKSLEHMHGQGEGLSHHHPHYPHHHPVHSRSLNPRIGTEHGHPSTSLDHISGYKPPLPQQPLSQQPLPQQRSYSQPAHMHQLSQRRAAYHDAGRDFSSGQNFELREPQRSHQFQSPEDNLIPRTPISAPPEFKDRHSREQLSTRQQSLSRELPPPPVFQDVPDSSSRVVGGHQGRGSAGELRFDSNQVHPILRSPQGPEHSREKWQHNQRSLQSPEHSLSPREGQHNLRPRQVVQQWVLNQTTKSGQPAGSESKPSQPALPPQDNRWPDQSADSRPVQQHNLWPRNAVSHQSTGHNLDSSLPPSQQQPIHSTRWDIQQEMNRLEHSLLQMDGKGQPPNKLVNGMREMGQYPDVVQHSTTTALSPLSSPEKSLPDLGRIDPRKPRLKKGKVPGAVWKPRPMNRAVESSSDSGSETTMPDSGTEYEHGETTSLKSTHV